MTVGNALSGVPGIGGIAGTIGRTAATMGYGRRKRRTVRRRRVGGSLRSILSSAHGFVRKNQLASKLLNHLGHSKLASAASSLGYGRKKTVRRRRVGTVVRRRAPVRRRLVRHRGGANFFSSEMLAAPRF